MQPLPTVPVHFIVLRDDDGGRPADAPTDALTRWVDFANHAFRDARISFALDPNTGIEPLACTLLNDIAGEEPERWRDARALGNRLAAERAGRALVLVRHGPGATPSGAAFAGIDHDFVVMGGARAMRHCGRPHVDALAHELGHYLGLAHTFRGDPFADLAAAEAHLAAHDGDRGAFDGDGLADTPPDPSIRAYECNGQPAVELLGQRFELPRNNLMSYYGERDSLSRLQVALARWVLVRRQANGMRLPANRPIGAVQAVSELSIVSANGVSTSRQPMGGYGAGLWSSDAQRFCHAREGARLELELPVAEPGRWRLTLYATLAPDYATLRCSLNGRTLSNALDLYAPRVLPSGPIALGSLALGTGPHRIAFDSIGRNPRSRGYHFGLDAIALHA